MSDFDWVYRCPVHDQPDCSPLLNGCSIVTRQVALLTELKQWRLRAETAENELSLYKAQWFGEFPAPDIDPARIKFRCAACWQEAQRRAIDGALTAEAYYKFLVMKEWCISLEQ